MKVEKYRVLGDLIEANKRQFIVPVYQRNYDWKKENCRKLFNDIVHSATTDRIHFLGSIVCVEQGMEHKIMHFLIIDGQQRITTLFLLLKALHDATDSDPLKSEISELIFNIDKYGDLHLTDQFKIKLKPVKTDNSQFMSLMNGELDKIDKASNIYINYDYLKSLIDKEVKKQDGIGYKDILDGIRHLTAAVIMLDSDDDPQEVFESINSTGLALSLADLIRNFILMTDNDQERLFNDYWLKIESNVTTDNMPDFITNYLLFACRDNVKSDNAYEVFKKTFRARDCTSESMLKELLKYSEYYKAFQGIEDPKYSKTVNRYLKEFKELDQSTIYPFFFHLFDDYNNSTISDKTLEDVLKFILTYIVRRLVCGCTTNKLRVMFRLLHQRVFSDSSSYKNYYESIVKAMCSFTTQTSIPSDATFKDSLLNGDLYNKKKLCKYILKTLENVSEDGMTVKEVVSIAGLTIEHIMPQTLTDEWKKELGPNYSQVYDRYLHTLGNLSLTGYNSELGQKSFAEKKQLIIDRKSHIVILNEDVLNKKTWNEAAIKDRADNLSRRLLSIFRLDRPTLADAISDKIDKNIIQKRRVTIGEDFEATGTRLESFIFLGESFQASSFADMFNQLITIFYELDGETLEDLARRNFKPETAQKPYLSMNKTALMTPFTIGDSGIFYESDLSAQMVIDFIRSLMDAFGFVDDDLILYIRPASVSEMKIGQYKEVHEESDIAMEAVPDNSHAYEQAYGDKPVFHVNVKSGVFDARIIHNDETHGYTILAGSEIKLDRDSEVPKSLKKLRMDALDSGDIVKTADGRYIMQRDINVSTITAAGLFVLGYPARSETWRDEDNKSPRDYYGITRQPQNNFEENTLSESDATDLDTATQSLPEDGPHIFYISRRGLRNTRCIYDIQSRKFVVLAGSEIDISKGFDLKRSSSSKRRKAALASGDIVQSEGRYYLVRDYSFESPSAAASFVLGSSSNGWVDWVDDNKIPIGNIYRQNTNKQLDLFNIQKS